MGVRDGLLIVMIFYAIRIAGKIAGLVLGATLLALNSTIEAINNYFKR
jgi:hypothetical protein